MNMKSTPSLFGTVLALWTLFFSSQNGFTQTATKFPFYIEVTQRYSPPESDWIEDEGDIEQVIGESDTAFVILDPDGNPFNLPKSLARLISLEDAAAQLLIDRQGAIAENAELQEQLDQLKQYLRSQKASGDSTRQMSEMLDLVNKMSRLENSQRNR